MHKKHNFHLKGTMNKVRGQRHHRITRHRKSEEEREEKGKGFISGVNNPFGGNMRGGAIIHKPTFQDHIPVMDKYTINNLKDLHLDFKNPKRKKGIKI